MAYLGQDIPKLGFGMMRLPKKDGVTDLAQTKEMVDLFMAAGFTYFDTAWAYGDSEDVTRQALVERYPRESFQLATKAAPWAENEPSREKAIAQFETSLERTGAGYFDFYLLHNVGQVRTRFYDDYGLWDWIAEKKAEGKIRHMGFSFHSTPEELDAVLTAHPEMEFVQLQINYADWDEPAVRARECYEVARRHGKPIVIMEPVKGGMLATPPESVQAVFKAAEPESSVASWGIRFAADLEGVITVLSGMSSTEQMRDNLSYMKDFRGLTDEQRGVIRLAQEELAKVPLIPCTGCSYCAKVCPVGVGISGMFTAMNCFILYSNLPSAQNRVVWGVDKLDRQRASACIGCGACEEVCPQHIAIRDELRRAAEALE